MHPDEQTLIQDLQAKMQQDQPVQKDPEAATVIDQTIATEPDAVYILTQAVLVQEQALHAAQEQINALNAQLAQVQQQAPPEARSLTGGGFLNHLFGQPSGGAVGVAPAGVQTVAAAPSAGSSFLRTAATTAVGVVAGETIFSGLGDLFS